MRRQRFRRRGFGRFARSSSRRIIDAWASAIAVSSSKTVNSCARRAIVITGIGAS